jgi:hypothetical protein
LSDVLYITLEAQQPEDDWEERISRGVDDRSRLSFERANELRLVVRRERFGLSIEPFFGSASFAALLRLKRRATAVIDAVRAIVSESFRFTDIVGILLRSESDAAPLLPGAAVSVDDALKRSRQVETSGSD